MSTLIRDQGPTHNPLPLPSPPVGKSDKLVDAVSILKERAVSEESSALFTLVSDLGKVCLQISTVTLSTIQAQ